MFDYESYSIFCKLNKLVPGRLSSLIEFKEFLEG